MNIPVSASPFRVAIVGGGPAGLMAAEVLASAGKAVQVTVYDAMPSVGRKFLLAGKGGLNLTHSEAFQSFAGRYGQSGAALQPMLDEFGGPQLREWAHCLGIRTFVGSSGRVFPTDMKAAPLLRAWLHRLRAVGVQFCMRHRWQGWSESGALTFLTPQGQKNIEVNAVVLALGGASWARLGSDGAWQQLLLERGVAVAPLMPSNCGFDVLSWTPFFARKFAGQPLKSVAITLTDSKGRHFSRKGEFVVTTTGVEGSLIYAASSLLRDEIAGNGSTTFLLDLLPDKSAAQVLAEVAHPRGSRSLSSHLKSRLGLEGVKAGLLHELLTRQVLNNAVHLAAAIKALPVRLARTRPIDEAISSAGGVRFEGLTSQLQIKTPSAAQVPTFCAGEMLDWEAPTGGYLLTACFASGRVAGRGVLAHLGL